MQDTGDGYCRVAPQRGQDPSRVAISSVPVRLNLCVLRLAVSIFSLQVLPGQLICILCNVMADDFHFKDPTHIQKAEKHMKDWQASLDQK